MPAIIKGTLGLRKMAQDLARPGDSSLAITLLNPSIYASTVGTVIKGHIRSNGIHCKLRNLLNTTRHCVLISPSVFFVNIEESYIYIGNSGLILSASGFWATRIMGAYNDDKVAFLSLMATYTFIQLNLANEGDLEHMIQGRIDDETVGVFAVASLQIFYGLA
ncbi:hypothetical protein BYT27DRAFT_7206954 [Phlegmacium glaucopus]|nr:hypothetical protein BYT27DRAFT_7206954 [Phlegmacium glaucopus]